MGVADLPLVIAPHPVADLKPDDLRDLAAAAYPHILAALTKGGPLALDYHVNYTLPWGSTLVENTCDECADGACELG